MHFPSLDELIAERIAAKEAEAQASIERTAYEAPEPDFSEWEAERRTQRKEARKTREAAEATELAGHQKQSAIEDAHPRQRNEDQVRLQQHMVSESGRPSIPAFSDLNLKQPRKRKRAGKPYTFFQKYIELTCEKEQKNGRNPAMIPAVPALLHQTEMSRKHQMSFHLDPCISSPKSPILRTTS
jgi:hypothetical protein